MSTEDTGRPVYAAVGSLPGPDPLSEPDAVPGAVASLVEGKTYEAWFPYQTEDDGGDARSWYPGFKRELYGHDEIGWEWQGEGVQRRTIIAIAKLPAPYKPRIFFKRSWIDPTGKVSASPRPLEMCGEGAFLRWLSGAKTDFLFEIGDMGESPYGQRKPASESLRDNPNPDTQDRSGG